MDDRKYRRLFSDLPNIVTNRLILRKISEKDLYDMYAYSREEEVSRYLMWSPHLNIEETRGHIEYLVKEYRKGRCTDWGVALKETDELIGTCGFASVDMRNNKAEIGYVLSPLHRGKGYMREAARAVVHTGFDKLGLNRIEARILVGNTASERLAENLGFKYEGTLRNALYIKGEYKSFSYYAITAEDYFNLSNG